MKFNILVCSSGETPQNLGLAQDRRSVLSFRPGLLRDPTNDFIPQTYILSKATHKLN